MQISLKYHKESFIDDDLICTLYQEKNNFKIVITNKSDFSNVCIIETECKKSNLQIPVINSLRCTNLVNSTK